MSVESLKLSPTAAMPRGLLAVAALVISLAAFSGPLVELVHRWTIQEEYSHGFLIPVVAAWLVWRRREAMFASVGQPSWAGPVLIFLAMGMHLIGELSALFVFSDVAFVVALV